MRPHGRANIDPRNPRATGICQRCGTFVNHDTLQWQYEWGGLKLINLRILVCPDCYDDPQIQLRTIILPQDPVPIEFPVPEYYVQDDNPLSGIGFQPTDLLTTVQSTAGAAIGNLTFFAGLNSAFDGNINKQSWRSAVIATSVSSYQNLIGRNWNAGLTSPPSPASVIQAPLTYSVLGFTVSAPSDLPLINSGATTGLELIGSNDGATWTTLYSTTTLGTAGEQVSSVSSNFLDTSNYQYHEVAIQGDGASQVSVAQVQFSVATTGNNEE